MAFYDLRSFLDKLEAVGDLQRIKAEVDWRGELCAIAQEAAETGAPALLFENIKDYKDTAGRDFAINILAKWERIALALDLPEHTNPKEIINVWRERTRQPIKPRLLSTGPCKEVIKKGKDINLFEFPVPVIHPKDGGRYTMWQLCVTKDPETGWVNVGMYNTMLLDKNLATISPIRTQHMAMHARKYEAMGKPMPYAIAIGTEPVTSMVACSPFPAGVCEYEMAGALRREPVDLVRCETVDLEVPATAEIVIEGTVSSDPDTYKPEGPFGRYTGYYTSIFSKSLAPAIDISCVTHRSNPVFIDDLNGLGSCGCHRVVALGTSAAIWDHLEEAGFNITGVWNDPYTLWHTIFISIEKTNYGEAKSVASGVWGSKLGAMKGKYVVVVDSDIDIFDYREISKAIAFRTRGQRDIIIQPYSVGSPLDPGIDYEFTQKAHMGSWDRVLIDATWPFEWEAREEWGGLKHPPSSLAEPEMLEKVRKRWAEYGLK